MTFCQFMYFTPQKKILSKIITAYITTLEICDYTVCDVTNPKMTIIESHSPGRIFQKATKY